MQTGTASAPGATASAPQTIPFGFRGSGAEYFRIWIVNLLLTIVTLGIYSAWAKVRRLRYLYGSTSLAGSTFEYHGRPLQILKGRLIAVGALVLYSLLTNIWPVTAILLVPLLLFAVPWVIVRSRMFQMQVTSWRNIRFRFHGTYQGALGAYVGWALLAALTLYVLLPLWLYKRVNFLLNNTSYGTQRLSFDKTAGVYFRFCYATGLMSIVAMVVGTFALVGLGGMKILSAATNVAADLNTGMLWALVPFLVVMALVALAIAAYYERSFTNAAFDNLGLGSNRIHCDLRTGALFRVYLTNAIGMVLTLGLYYPWARINRLRYQFERMQLQTEGSLENFTAGAAPESSATGEELGEFFDVDFGL
jgi:uncharacterized membrane protein YjgN (DUF898 family)